MQGLCGTGRRSAAIAQEHKSDISSMYDKCPFIATNAQKLFDSATVVLSTSAEILSANNKIIHHVRSFVGDLQFPFHISSDLAKITANVDKVLKICKAQRSFSRNLMELSGIARKVAAKEAYVNERVCATKFGDEDDGDDGDEDFPIGNEIASPRHIATAKRSLYKPSAEGGNKKRNVTKATTKGNSRARSDNEMKFDDRTKSRRLNYVVIHSDEEKPVN